MEQSRHPNALPQPTHVPVLEKLRNDLLCAHERASRNGCLATAQALQLAVEMLEVEQDPAFLSVRFDDAPRG